jgi:Leucine-rich repeat (LRR) protein
MPPKKKAAAEPEAPKVPRSLYTLVPLDGRDGGLGVEALDLSERVREVQAEQVAARVAYAVQSGELDLDLRDCGLSDLPDALFDLQWLQVVDLSRNALVPRVFEELRDLAGLRAVNLAQNLLSNALPAALGDLPAALEELCLDDNNVEALPAEAAALAGMEWFSARRNLLQELPGAVLGAWTRLAYLDLRNNKLRALPAEVGLCAALRELYLSDNELAELPDSIGGCASLEVLLAQRNRLAALPAGLGACASLLTLDVTGNALAEVAPAALAGLASVRALFFGSNKLQGLPAEIGLCASLEQLSVPSNQLRGLPDEIGALANLREINCGNNPIVALPQTAVGWVKLESGNFRNCKLKALPAGIETAWKQATLLDVRAKGKKDTCKSADTVKSELKFTRFVGVVWSKPKGKKK